MDTIQSLLQILETEETVILATIIATNGSTPTSALSKMIVTSNRWIGTVGGGCMEADVVQAARDLHGTGKAKILTFHLNENDMVQGLICGGSLEVLLEPVTRASVSLYQKLKGIRDNGNDSVVATRLSTTGEIMSKELINAQDQQCSNATTAATSTWTYAGICTTRYYVYLYLHSLDRFCF